MNFDDLIIITVTNEDGTETRAAIMDDFDLNGKRYLALQFENLAGVDFCLFENNEIQPLPPEADRKAIYSEYAARNGIDAN